MVWQLSHYEAQVSQMSEEFVEAVFVIADAEKFPDSRKLAEVDNLPTFAAFRDGALAIKFRQTSRMY